MFASRISTAITAAMAVGLGAAGFALASAGGASASTADDAFIAAISEHGIGFDSPQQAIMDGYLVCLELNAGNSGPEIARQVLSQTNLGVPQADHFVVDAARAYCPQFAK
jgi:hypothetical protein